MSRGKNGFVCDCEKGIRTDFCISSVLLSRIAEGSLILMFGELLCIYTTLPPSSKLQFGANTADGLMDVFYLGDADLMAKVCVPQLACQILVIPPLRLCRPLAKTTSDVAGNRNGRVRQKSASAGKIVWHRRSWVRFPPGVPPFFCLL